MATDAPAVRIVNIVFQHYKALPRFSIALEHVNVLTGANNSGKSTIIGGLRALAVALRTARSRKPERVRVGELRPYGYQIKESLLPISLENVASDYEEGASRITFRLSNGNSLHLHFDREDGCVLIPETTGLAVTTVAQFRSAFPISLAVVPVLGPVEHNEALREISTVGSALATHRASRHFRNYWYHYPEGFDEFAILLASTWPGMHIKRPELNPDRELSMFVSEQRIDRELYWVGFGFQIWCQLLTHLHRAASASLVVVDEPEVYLHPEIQRRLLGVLKDIGTDVLVATHSTEIIAEADPAEIVLIDKRRARAERLKDIDGIQRAMSVLGSQQNIMLASLARNRRMLFVESDQAAVLIRRFARRLGMKDLAAGLGFATMSSGGLLAAERIRSLGAGMEKKLGGELAIGVVYDGSGYSDEQVAACRSQLAGAVTFVEVLPSSELEDYLLVPAAIDRAVGRILALQEGTTDVSGTRPPGATQMLEQIRSELRKGAEVASEAQDHQHARDHADRAAQGSRGSKKLAVPESGASTSGREVLRLLRQRLQTSFGITLTDARIVDVMRPEEMAAELRKLLETIERFRRMPV
jgi:energy-coupling factor transporter ATP-binding protein EcfA2